ncbi:hypothetical protein [Cellulomonas alba]|uniref:Uncharacterized protein n=1 Tax=Cellulomonas alba TaxID=3053467 RepID=A0ABT7SD53_9CELL|nr:hypothetical protein [Cellulomonas alba]MDM7854105.1 hypothetical protein [Cellulomonas alba]
MTLIVAYLDKDYAVIASDRRITWNLGGARSQYEDVENKALLLCGHLLVGYTGFARFDGLRTDEFIVRVLTGLPVSEYLATIARITEQRIRNMRRLKVKQRGHAYLAVGFLNNLEDPEVLVPVAFSISNALGPTGRWQPQNDFRVERYPLGDHPFLLRTVPPGHDELATKYRKWVAHYRKARPGRMRGILDLMVRLIREAASTNDAISPDVSVAVLPKVAVGSGEFGVGLVREPIVEVSAFSLVQSEGDVVSMYGPATVCPAFASYGAETHFGASADQFGRPRPSAGPPP